MAIDMEQRLSTNYDDAATRSIEHPFDADPVDSRVLIPQRLLPSIIVAAIGFVVLIGLLAWANLDDGPTVASDQTILAQDEDTSGLRSAAAADPPASDSTGGDAATAGDTAPATATDTGDPGSSIAAPVPTPDSATPAGATVGDEPLTLRGMGALRIGMTVDEAVAEFGSPIAETDGLTGECRIGVIPGDPASPSFLIHAPNGDLASGTIRRIDLTGAAQVTLSGIHIGSTKDDVLAAYGDRITATPHKYETAPDSEYLTYRPVDPADDAYRLVFETSNGIVTAVRTGLVPEVELVEGCA